MALVPASSRNSTPAVFAGGGGAAGDTFLVINTRAAGSDAFQVSDATETERFAVTTGLDPTDNYVLASCPLQVANPLTGFNSLSVNDNVGGFARVSDGGVLKVSGYVQLAQHAAPNSADMDAGDLALWFDQTNGAAKLMVKAKQADGTVKTAAVALA